MMAKRTIKKRAQLTETSMAGLTASAKATAVKKSCATVKCVNGTRTGSPGVRVESIGQAAQASLEGVGAAAEADADVRRGLKEPPGDDDRFALGHEPLDEPRRIGDATQAGEGDCAPLRRNPL